MSFLFESLPVVSSIVCEDQILEGKSGKARFRITCYRPDIFRIQVTKEENFENFSYAVIREPEKVKLQLKETENHLELISDKGRISLNKEQFLINFLDNRDQLLVADEPGLGTGWIEENVSTFKTLQEGERFIGLGEKTRNLDKRGEGFTNWNTDAFGYHSGSDPLYSTIPFYIGIHHGVAYGLFLDNSFKSHFNFGASNHRFSSITAEGGDMNYYLFTGLVAEIIEAYTWLTGRMELPPKWSLGYQQCRYSYYPESEVLNLAQTFREKQIPCDVIYLDIHYMKDYKVFTWDEARFPEPARMIEQVKKQGFHVAVIVDPGVKIEPGYETYKDGLDKDVFVKYPDGQNYTADVWPGTCHFPDFTLPAARTWWGEKFKDLIAAGVEGIWNDMNEIASWGNFMPDLLQFDYDGQPTSSLKARNVYGTQMARATKEGMEKLMGGNRRNLVITRAAYAGFQRYGTLWTGDNVSSDESMLLGCRMVAGLGISGMAFTGNDVGGFAGHTEGSLFVRWLSIAVFQPFLRAHTFVNTLEGEPWSFGEEIEEISRNYINLRYRLMPYVYAAFREASLTGMPVVRTLALDHTHDARVYDERFQNQFLFGPSILVAPVESNIAITKVFLPPGEWINLHTGEIHRGDDIIYVDSPPLHLPVFVKGGSVLPMQSIVQHTAEKHDGKLRLHLYPGSSGSSFEFYEDDGVSKTFDKGEYSKRVFMFDGTSTLTISAPEGTRKSEFSILQIILHGPNPPSEINFTGKSAKPEVKNFSFFEPISHFDAYAAERNHPYFEVSVAQSALNEEEVKITW